MSYYHDDAGDEMRKVIASGSDVLVIVGDLRDHMANARSLISDLRHLDRDDPALLEFYQMTSSAHRLLSLLHCKLDDRLMDGSTFSMWPHEVKIIRSALSVSRSLTSFLTATSSARDGYLN